MKELCTPSAELEKLGKRVIKNRKALHFIKDFEIRIGYAVSDKEKKKQGGLILGECHLVKPIYQAFIPYDFIVVFYEPNIIGLSDKQKEILMYHELLHVGVNDSGEADYKIVPHDVEDFSVILKRYGLDWAKPQ